MSDPAHLAGRHPAPFIRYLSLMIKRLWPLMIFYCSCSTGNSNIVDVRIDSSKIGKIKKVVILGNSIVNQGPQPEIGWSNNWGMAASARDSDFVHLLIKDIGSRDTTVVMKYKNIADFERNYTTYRLSDLDSAFINPDILILKLGENVIGKTAIDSNFIYYYDKLIHYVDKNGSAVKVIVDGFWWQKNVNPMVRKYAKKNNYTFVLISDLQADKTNTAKGKFTNPGVAAHPSDKGMRMIGQRIWQGIKYYFQSSDTTTAGKNTHRAAKAA